jgi:hypothetical protein
LLTIGLEQALGKTAIKELMPMQPGDVQSGMAFADSSTGSAPIVTPLACSTRLRPFALAR